METTFSFPKFRTVPGLFRFFYFRFFFSFPNVSRNENILFLKKLFLFGYPKCILLYHTKLLTLLLLLGGFGSGATLCFKLQRCAMLPHACIWMSVCRDMCAAHISHNYIIWRCHFLQFGTLDSALQTVPRPVWRSIASFFLKMQIENWFYFKDLKIINGWVHFLLFVLHSIQMVYAHFF